MARGDSGGAVRERHGVLGADGEARAGGEQQIRRRT